MNCPTSITSDESLESPKRSAESAFLSILVRELTSSSCVSASVRSIIMLPPSSWRLPRNAAEWRASVSASVAASSEPASSQPR